ncbi:TetR family transcriptional regulator [Actinocorallia herbida]|uniref:TetR family transcriptional regulator n=1 Tax=Actinocorallia herbida TaxID=58109 RepID=A0A3N1CZY9_9ACTN|nr:TetR/AcrR family transcriptional regulator [Actinocorallia herbida]ROO86822.1 TetR family transcriptional regulator [Actinocorallia herbida]
MTEPSIGGDRADARRNRARVLSVAGAVFAEQGLEVPLGEIARRAGVGAGTVYRHFPSKNALLEAVFAQHLHDLVAIGERRTATSAPTEAFFGFLLDVVEGSYGRSHICDVLAADASWPQPMLTAARLRFHQVMTALLRAAQRAGGVRADLGPEDVGALAIGCGAILAARRDRAAGRRLVQLALDGLRPPDAVTEPSVFRDNLGVLGETVTPCAECGVDFPVRPTGRRARYCGAACRQRAHRRRVAG